MLAPRHLRTPGLEWCSKVVGDVKIRWGQVTVGLQKPAEEPVTDGVAWRAVVPCAGMPAY